MADYLGDPIKGRVGSKVNDDCVQPGFDQFVAEFFRVFEVGKDLYFDGAVGSLR